MGCLLSKPPPAVVAQPYDPSEPLRPDLPHEAEALSDAIRRATGVPIPRVGVYVFAFGAINADSQPVVRYIAWSGSASNPPTQVRALLELRVRYSTLINPDEIARDIGPV